MSEETVTTEGTATAPEAQAQQSNVPKRHLRKSRVGEVVSNKMDKIIVVEVVRRVPHLKFGKIVKCMKKFYTHEAENCSEIGVLIQIQETRPFSRLKHWKLYEVL